MGRGKPQTNPPPKPGGRVDRKVIIEFSSDESFDEERPQPVEESGAPKRVGDEADPSDSTCIFESCYHHRNICNVLHQPWPYKNSKEGL